MSKRIFARYKVPKIEETREWVVNNLENEAKFFGMTKNQLFDHTLLGIIGDITGSTEKIEREKQRIRKAKKALNNILISTFKDKNIRNNVKGFYGSLLRENILKIKRKIKR